MRTFGNINATVTTDTDNYFRTDPSEGTLEARLGKRMWWVRSASRAYGVDCPVVRVSPNLAAGRGVYSPSGSGRITLGTGMSNIALFRNFRKHLQNRAVAGTRRTKADSRGYAHSLYRTVRPDLYARLVAEGQIR